MQFSSLMSIAQEHASRGEHTQAARSELLALDADPYHEDAIALAMESLMLAGERITALEQYRVYVDRLRAARDQEPSPRLMRLVKRIRSTSILMPQ